MSRFELPDHPFSIFILAGQSNMAGRGQLDTPEPIDTTDMDIWTMNDAQYWIPAKHPLHFDKPKRVGVGPGLNFAASLINLGYPEPIALIPCAVGGTSLSRWEPEGDLYERMIRWSTIAMTEGEIKGVLWHQGENDATSMDNANSYFGRILQMINALRTDLGNTRLPFIAGELGDFIVDDVVKYPGAETINHAVRQISEHVPNCAGIATTGLGHIGDDTHFDGEGAHEMGRRYAAAYLTLTNQLKNSIEGRITDNEES